MESTTRHVTRCMVAGIVALLPLVGAVFTLYWLENTIASSWRERLPFYFPGLGLLLGALAVYAIGLFVTTFLGRWLWRRLDRLLEALPLVGSFYESLKEVLGYDSTRARFFQGVVAVPHETGHELGLLTGAAKGPDGRPCGVVFVPGSPNPTNGKLVLIAEERLVRLDVKVGDAMRAIVSLGKAPLVGGS